MSLLPSSFVRLALSWFAAIGFGLRGILAVTHQAGAVKRFREHESGLGVYGIDSHSWQCGFLRGGGGVRVVVVTFRH